jgi:hypothetical protein
LSPPRAAAKIVAKGRSGGDVWRVPPGALSLWARALSAFCGAVPASSTNSRVSSRYPDESRTGRLSPRATLDTPYTMHARACALGGHTETQEFGFGMALPEGFEQFGPPATSTYTEIHPNAQQCYGASSRWTNSSRTPPVPLVCAKKAPCGGVEPSSAREQSSGDMGAWILLTRWSPHSTAISLLAPARRLGYDSFLREISALEASDGDSRAKAPRQAH